MQTFIKPVINSKVTMYMCDNCFNSIDSFLEAIPFERIYLVDCENYGYSFFSGPHDLILYFINNSMEYPYQLAPNEIVVSFEHDECKDALDFAIDTYLGYLIGKLCKSKYDKEVKEFYLISNDKGFSNVSQFWRSLGYQVYSNDNKIDKKAVNTAKVPTMDAKDIQLANKVAATISSTAVKNIYKIDINTINCKQISNLDDNYKTKLQHIYDSWLRSKSKDINTLQKDLKRCLQNLYKRKEILIIASALQIEYINNKLTA